MNETATLQVFIDSQAATIAAQADTIGTLNALVVALEAQVGAGHLGTPATGTQPLGTDAPTDLPPLGTPSTETGVLGTPPPVNGSHP